MLQSELEERSRRFTLALRAGIPVLLLVFLVFFTTIDKRTYIYLDLKDGLLITSIIFITIYFIYFLMDLSVQETIVDQTTQGFTKKAFIDKLQKDKPQAVACLNIENLQSLNENYSSEQIDTLLYTITRKLNLVFKQHGFEKVLIGRHRGSEFLLALNGDAQNVQNILDDMIQNSKLIENIEVDYKFAVITNPHTNFENIIHQLRDLINSQMVGTHTEKVPASVQDAKELSNVEKCVIGSLQNKNLLLSFRPLLNTYSDTIDTYEIAVKLKAITGEDILPRVFLPIINRLGLGREYDLTLIKHVIDLLPLVDDSISFTFNLSPFSLRDRDFQTQFLAYLKEKEVTPSRLIIQLYERKTHHDLSGYLKTLKYFRSHGIRICIDNFGSSNASMEYMKHFKFDIVQFDRDYVTNLDNSTTYAMLNSLIKMSKDLQVQTVAKWVDNEEQKKKLRVLGINYIQGFGVSKALNETDLINRYN